MARAEDDDDAADGTGARSPKRSSTRDTGTARSFAPAHTPMKRGSWTHERPGGAPICIARTLAVAINAAASPPAASADVGAEVIDGDEAAAHERRLRDRLQQERQRGATEPALDAGGGD